MTKPDLGRYGVFGRGATPQQATEIEALGYGAIWVGGSPPAELDWVEPLLGATERLKVATGIVNIWTAAAGPVAESFHRINTAYPGRFVLGVGSSSDVIVQRWNGVPFVDPYKRVRDVVRFLREALSGDKK